MKWVVKPIPLKRRFHTGDPETSVEAAWRAKQASREVIKAVIEVMSDGRGRIDEEIWEAVRDNGCMKSLNAVQMARLALAESSQLMPTERYRLTELGSPSRVWKLAPEGYTGRYQPERRGKRVGRAKAPRHVIRTIREVMSDGVGRIDEEIWEACHENNKTISSSAVRHARLVLSDRGKLVVVGKRRTSNGCRARIWRKA